MKKLIFILLPLFSFSQNVDTTKFWLEFNDKGTAQISDYSASDLFSLRAIERREKQNISINYSDLPISADYVQSLENMQVQILGKSKWFNGVLCSYASDDVAAFGNLNFVKSLEVLYVTSDSTARIASKFEDVLADSYGTSYDQLSMLNGQVLHQNGFQGQNIQIAVFDAGFRNANNLDVFSSLINNNQILGTWDFVAHESSVYEDHSHGTSVLSFMASELQGEMIGTAPKADYWLFRTEDGAMENLIEEYNWLMAAELADSLGVDVINSSLGYTEFDLAEQNHTYKDMDGRTTPISRAALMASRKGILVSNSAGNSGNNSWYFIGAPADADSILTVGSVDVNRSLSYFSSKGPTADSRIKPTVCALGQEATYANTNNEFSSANGTSFSSPIIAGMAACLWQANYSKSNMEIIQAITESAHLFNDPNNQLGYGIPNFGLAHALLNYENVNDGFASVYPNPVTTSSNAYVYSAEVTASVNIYTVSGKLIFQQDWLNSYFLNTIELPRLDAGVYLLQVNLGENSQLVEKLVVTN